MPYAFTRLAYPRETKPLMASFVLHSLVMVNMDRAFYQKCILSDLIKPSSVILLFYESPKDLQVWIALLSVIPWHLNVRLIQKTLKQASQNSIRG